MRRSWCKPFPYWGDTRDAAGLDRHELGGHSELGKKPALEEVSPEEPVSLPPWPGGMSPSISATGECGYTIHGSIIHFQGLSTWQNPSKRVSGSMRNKGPGKDVKNRTLHGVGEATWSMREPPTGRQGGARRVGVAHRVHPQRRIPCRLVRPPRRPTQQAQLQLHRSCRPSASRVRLGRRRPPLRSEQVGGRNASEPSRARISQKRQSPSTRTSSRGSLSKRA